MIFLLKITALLNIESIEVTEETSQEVISPLKLSANENMNSILRTLETSHKEISPLKLTASSNMLCMFFTVETSHFDIPPPLNLVALENINFIFVTCDVSQSRSNA